MNYKKKTMKLIYEKFDIQKELCEKDDFFQLSVHEVVSQIGLLLDNVEDVESWKSIYYVICKKLKHEEIELEREDIIDETVYSCCISAEQVLSEDIPFILQTEKKIKIYFEKENIDIWKIPLEMKKIYSGYNLYFRLDSNMHIFCIYALE